VSRSPVRSKRYRSTSPSPSPVRATTLPEEREARVERERKAAEEEEERKKKQQALEQKLIEEETARHKHGPNTK